ncbi:MAG: hypothetical protein M0Q45_03655 [Bacteroidales bacterium]|nr:hypothetical protein [Bacteroidales bacterium]MCK9498583.1 hypothetical protein [Bacteroidales bacterium]MDY0315111.1 hypothetical protein [Bacteroidales bacterium]
MKKQFVILLALIFVLLSCNKENIKPRKFPLGSEYFPLNTSNNIIYKITEINIDKPSNVYDTSIYYLNEIVESPFIDNENDTAWRIERYIRKNNNSNWIINAVWSAKITKEYVVKVEENQRKIKIRFPIKKDLSWNGNLLNDMEIQEYKISRLDHKYDIGSFKFDSCLTVLHDSSLSLIHKNLNYEVYAKNIGLIYKEEIYINSQEVTHNVPIEQRITTGKIFIQEFISKN